MHNAHTSTRHSEPEDIFRGRSSRVYDRATRWLLRGLYRRIAEDIADSAPDRATVLDVGTGPGHLVTSIARLRPDLDLIGVDLSPDMIAQAEQNLRPYGTRATARTADAADLPFADSSIGLIVSSYSLHHWDNPGAVVPELGRVLAPGGRLYIYDWRNAPFTKVDEAAREHGVLTGRPHRRTLIRTGTPVQPHVVRHVMTNPE
ncbi:ubiquinone/menaquinone biosynthesis C-methylase UbiE [Lipingzhangella halophila]|uniref:Ubiquinone/menaquinone biosynthesis C-methylase UbiE n=1 Tax=Lipingzhangella halophila TaxID=1783352 RepID=A0A7W7W5N9_9ACTN|nr:class I SAM-dependent methyltransferase [Lipingzhangella halophila]MBB4934981.1 ubiquinone/menaquinone biosynthesis C-methylase UbiE [Lipingzhangella halophila]